MPHPDVQIPARQRRKNTCLHYSRRKEKNQPMIEKQSTAHWTYEEWQIWRKKVTTIGGSDASVILGLNPWKSPMALWLEKTGKVEPEDISGKESVRLGNDLEEYVAKRFTEATGKKVRRERCIIRNTDYPFGHANLDRVIVGEPDAALECKTTSNIDIIRLCRDGEIPPTYYCQCVHYMMVCKFKRMYLAVLAFGSGFYHFVIERDEGEIKALARAEDVFYSNVIGQTPPPVDGTDSTRDAIAKLYGKSTHGSVDITSCMGSLASYAAIKQQIGQLTHQLQEAQAIIEMHMGEAERGSCSGYSVSWKTQERSTFDRTRWEADHGKIPEEYFKTSTIRPFKVTVK